MTKNNLTHCKTETAVGYRRFTIQRFSVLIILVVLVLLMALFSLCVGSSNLSPLKAILALCGGGEPQTRIIVLSLRLPRVLAAIVCGGGLAAVGCVMQAVLRNPLADATTLGVSQGAAFGAAFAIIVCGAASSAGSVQLFSSYLTTICAFLCALGATFCILLLSRIRQISPTVMVLSGVAISAMFSGGSALLQYFGNDTEVSSVVFWTFGDLGRVSYHEVGIIATVVLVSLLYFGANRWNFNALQSGGATARGLGVEVSRVRLLSMGVCALCAATVVSFVGIINFVGLIAPHMVRRFVGGDYRYLLPASVLGGSLLLLCSDIAARLVASPIVLPIGAITSLVGAPVFLFLICKGGRLGVS